MATIRKRSENTYQFIVSLGLGADKKYKRKYKTYTVKEKMTPKQLKEHLEHEAYKFEQQVLSEAYITPNEMSVKQFAQEWQEKWLEKNLSESTIMTYLYTLNNHILPVLGHLNINKINTLMLLDLMENLKRKDGKDKELSISSKQEVYKVLMSLFKRAEEWNVINNNPMLKVKKPKNVRKNKNELNVYDVEEVKQLMETVQEELEHWRIFISLALATGMRRGELLGLEWDAVDLESGVIDIRQTIIKTRNGSQITSPKWDSKRLISLPQSILEDLKEFKHHCRKEKMRLQHKWTEKEHDWVFFNENGRYFYPDTPSRWWKRFLKRKKIRHIRL